MAVDTKPARERRGTTLSLREQQDLGNIPPSSFASRTGPGGLFCRAASLCPSNRRTMGPGSCACPAGCWAAWALHIMQRCTRLPARLMLDAFEWRTVTPSWQSLLWYRYGLKLVNPKLYPLLSFTEPFPILESSSRRLQGSQCLLDLGLECHWTGAVGDLPC